jgi:rubrerythrin
MGKSANYLVIGGLAFAMGAGIATAAGTINSQTKANLDTAMHGEAFATAKYLLYAAKAYATNQPALGAYFEQAARTERTDHFAKEAKLFGLVGTNEANLSDAIAGEDYETTTMYPKFAAEAEAAGDAEAAALFREIASDEAKHRNAFQNFLAKLKEKTTN